MSDIAGGKKMNKCNRCGHEWKTKTKLRGAKERKLPLCCPRCKRYDWGEKDGEKY